MAKVILDLSLFPLLKKTKQNNQTGSCSQLWYFITSLFIYFLNIYLFILAVPGLSCNMWDLLIAACRLLSCGMRAVSSSPTRDRTQDPCIGSVESYPLNHQGSPVFQV